MKLRIATYLLVTAFFIGSITPTFSQSPEQLFQKGLVKEEGEGALNEAIDIYNKIVENQDADKSLQAKALLHVGQCYEKLGRNEATKAYQRLVNNFPGQKNEVAIARERLSRLILAVEEITKTPQTPKFTKIKIPTNPGNGVLSPNGNKLAFVSDGSIWIIPLHGKVDPDIAGEPTLLAELPGAWDYGSLLSWSADGKWIAVNGEETEEGTVAYNVQVAGGKSHEVRIPNRGGHSFSYRLSLSPNGQMLAFSAIEPGLQLEVQDPNDRRIFTIPVSGGDPKQVSSNGAKARLPSFSPDGEFIAYVGYKKGNIGELWIVPSTGGNPIKLASVNGRLRGPVWSPDRKYIAAHHEPGNNNSSNEILVYTLSYDLSTTEEPTKITLPGESFNLLAGWTPDNELGVFIQSEEYPAIYTVPASGGKAVQVTPEGQWPYYPRWSSDGNRIYFRPPFLPRQGVDDENKQSPALYVSATGGNPVGIPVVKSNLDLTSRVPGGGFNISPDGKKIVVSTGTEPSNPNEGNLWTISLTDGVPIRLPSDRYFDCRYPCWSPDGKWIAFIDDTDTQDKNYDEGFKAIYIIPAEGGKIRQITSKADSVGGGAITFSTNGEQIAFFSGSTITSITVEGGQSEILVANIKSESHSQLAYSPDGSKIAHNAEGKIWITALDEGIPQELHTGLPKSARLSEFGWSPNGKKIAFFCNIGGEAEFWLINNFMPLEKLAQKKETEVSPKTTTLQKVWFGDATIMWGSPSPNGQFLTYSDPATLNLAMRDLSSSETSILTNDASEHPLQFNMGSVVSPNNKQIAYAWYKNNHELRIIDVDNPQPKVIYGNKGEDVYPCTWSPDGKTIYAKSYLNNTRKCRILAISVLNGDVQVLKTFDGFYWLQLSVSPDNQFVAYHYPSNKNGEIADTDIHLISTDGKNETKLFEHPANDQILGWFPDKNQILFKSDRSGTWDAWTVEVFNGNAAGEPEKVLPEIGENAAPMGFTKNGAFYYSLISRKFDAFTVPLDQTNGVLKSKSAKPLLGSIRNAKWSPNGKLLALIKENWKINQRPVLIRNSETGEERMLTDNLSVRHLLWLQDNKTLLILGNDKKREPDKNYTGGLYTIDVQTGSVNELLPFSDYQGKEWEIGLKVAQMLAYGNLNQKSIYYIKNGQLLSRELATGQEKILIQNESFHSNNYTLDPLPGEKNLLFCNEDQIYVIPTTGGKQITIAKCITSNSLVVENSAVWSTDGNYIFYTQNKDDGSVLWRVTAEGKNPTEVWHSNAPISSLSIHPDGCKIVITTLNQESEIWKAENLIKEVEKIYSENE